MSVAHNLNGIPGLVQLRKSRQTGTMVGIYDGELQGLDTESGRWSTVCEEHGTVIAHQTLALAKTWAPVPDEWCEDCMARGS